ncbi:unnamed protein product [Tilletia laevis]|uniref:RNA polymerase I-specific transcription initiation factor RRN3 n=1 Tax=Tilletia laevis TaxID=157183 RepID=A0A9N8LHL5_9BASI|nr:hypothetical protein CF336_g8068 [Tilletia laevis]KAE8184664.1 hypothetical protein CF328_g7791 [Tilletia controversa]CAD6904636.1 unnamed protein product [Tilletia controversa]CAD6920419.1 unnamed protein product [Tilletia laevis]CAD6949835.1 unnamed protein product [Tilletia laevis]
MRASGDHIDIQKATASGQRKRDAGKAARAAAATANNSKMSLLSGTGASIGSGSRPVPGALRLSKLAPLTGSGSGGSAAAPHSPTMATTPGSARKRTYDTLLATDTPPQSPSRTTASLSGSTNTHDLADAYRPTLYAAFLANVFADSANTAAANATAAGAATASTPAGKRAPFSLGSTPASNSASYNQLIAQLRISTASRPSGSASLGQLTQWLSALTHHVSKLDHRNHAELVEAILAIPWPTLGPAISRAWTVFVCSLLSARPEWLGAVLEHAVRSLGYYSEWHELPLAAAPSYIVRSATRRHVYMRVHALLRSLLSLIPTLPTTLFPLLLANLPPKRSPSRTQGVYILNLLRVTEYAPELTEGLWAAVVHRVMSIDVEVQMDVEDLEDDSGRLDFLDGTAGQDSDGAPLLNSVIIDILDRPLAEEDADDFDADSDVDPTDAIGDDILNDPSVYDGAAKDADAGIALDELSSGDESSGSDAEDGNGPPKSAAQRRADAMLKQQDSVRTIKKNVKKLDVVMQILYEYLRRADASFISQFTQSSSGYFDDASPAATGSLSRSKSSSTIGKKGRSSDDDEDLLMAAGQMDEDEVEPDTPLASSKSSLGAGIKLRRVDSPVSSIGRSQRGSIFQFEPTPSPSPGLVLAGSIAHPARRSNLFHILLSIFDRLVLPTFRSRHVQFVMFWFSSLDAEYADTFLGMLLSKSLYSGPGAVAEHGRDKHGGGGGNSIDAVLDQGDNSMADLYQRHEASSPILRKAAASYVASLVSRASFIGTPHTRAVVLNMCAFLDAYLEQYAFACAHAGSTRAANLSLDGGVESGSAGGPPAPGSAVHDVFYSIAQALFYIFCFRWRDLELNATGSGMDVGAEGGNKRRPRSRSRTVGAEPASFSGTGSSLGSSAGSAAAAAAAAAHWTTNGFGPGSGPRSMEGTGGVRGMQEPLGPAAASFGTSDRVWCDGLDVVQRVITSSLNPLRYCSPTVVRQFAYVAKVTGLVYCYSIIEANNRMIGTASSGVGGAPGDTSVSMTASGTLKPLRAVIAKGRNREDTPTRPGQGQGQQGKEEEEDSDDDADEEDNLPQPAGSERLDGFFPFDPYRLQNSMGFVEGLYRQWEDVAPEDEDDSDDEDDEEEEEEEGEGNSSDASSESSSDSSDDDSDEEEDNGNSNNSRRLKAPPPSGAVLIPSPNSRRAGSHSSGSGGERDRFAQSFEAMSLSPDPTPL